MRKSIAICLSLTLILTFFLNSMVLANNLPDPQTDISIHKAVGCLHTIQNKDGGFPVKAGGPSSEAATCWVIMALQAAGEDVTSKTWAAAGFNPINYLQNSNICLESTSDYARLLLALTAAKQSPVFHDINLADKIITFQQKGGQFAQPLAGEAGYINSHLWSILALTSAGYDIPNKEMALKWLLQQQNEDGGFGWAQGIASDSDDTGIAIQALVILGEEPESSPAIKNAMSYLKRCQEDDGGFSSGNDWMSNGSNASSTAWVLQGLIAAGANPSGVQWIKGGNNPISYLLNLQNQNGWYNWKAEVMASPVTTTAQTIMALTQKPFPVNVDYCPDKTMPAEKSRFSDLSSGYWAYKSIIGLVDAGVLNGYPDGTFKPENRVTRAEFTRYLVSGLGLSEMKPDGLHTFPDVPPSHWALNYISITAAKGYVTGMPDGSFNPNGEISGAELATMMVKALPADQQTKIGEGSFWYSGYVECAQQYGLLYPDFQPTHSASRAQCAYSVVQLRKLINKI